MLLNFVLFIPGVAGFLYLSWLHLAHSKKSGPALMHDEQQSGSKPGVKLSRVGGYCWSVTVHLVLQILPFVLWRQWAAGESQAKLATTAATTFTGLTIAYSVREIKSHLQNYFQPRIQKHIIRILIMPVIYALDCWVSLWVPLRV